MEYVSKDDNGGSTQEETDKPDKGSIREEKEIDNTQSRLYESG